jgi:hypothetical protein
MKFALALIVTLLAAFPALASPSCMTKHEARARYQTSYLYWRTEHHCWYAGHESRRHIAKRSAPALAAPQHAERMPKREPALAGADTVSIWPNPPTIYTWADRWPEEKRISPARWLNDLMQFGN